MPFDATSFESNKTYHDLTVAKRLIENPELWCKGNMHRANKRCMLGALKKALGYPNNLHLWRNDDLAHKLLGEAIYELLPQKLPDDTIICQLRDLPESLIWRYNDHNDTQHADVMDAFDRAIELSLTREKV